MPVEDRTGARERHAFIDVGRSVLVGIDLDIVEEVAVDDQLDLGALVLAHAVVFEELAELPVVEEILEVVAPPVRQETARGRGGSR